MADQDTAPDEPEITAGGLYPIRTVATLTGVNPVTLRAWERRYSLIRPQRTPKGHRLYSTEQIELIKRTVALLEQGIAISQVGPFLEQHESLQTSVDTGDSPWQRYLEQMLAAIARFDDGALDQVYNDVLSLYPVDLVTMRLIMPLLRRLGEDWQKSDSGIAQEHFFAVFLRNKLGARFHHLHQQRNGPRLLMACIPGEFHESGLLLFCLSAINAGYRILLLGANMPLQGLPSVAARTRVKGIVLSASVRPPQEFFHRQLQPLVQQLDIPVFFGGSASDSQANEIRDCGAIALGGDYQMALQTLKAKLRRS